MNASAPISRADHLERLSAETFDLAIIGAGINGAAIARDAAMRGLKVALIDKGDIAGATSSRSSKLIHGGFRYIPQGQLLLVYHALRERERLRRLTAPHLVRPIRFLFPIYNGRGFGRLSMAAGLFVYDLFARAPRAERHLSLDARAVSAAEPALSAAGLRGGAMYYDGWADDARLTLENALDAIFHGAAVLNYAALEGFIRGGQGSGPIAAAGVRDLESGRAFELRARAFVNAAGPWVDDVRRLDDPAGAPSVRLTKGVHLVIARERLPVRDALVLADERGRIVFAMPHERYVLVGTTDTDFDGDRDAVACAPADADYLLAVLAESLPAVRLCRGDVASSFAGLRALVRADGEPPSKVPREEVILKSRSGMLTVAGGKLTTHREIAQKLTERAMRELGRAPGRCPTLDTPLPGARPMAGAGALEALSAEARAILRARYGTRAEIPAKLIRERPELGAPLASGCPALAAEVVHAVRCELALSVRDFLVRRTALMWRYPDAAAAAAENVARLMAAELGWDAARMTAELAGFNDDFKRRRFE